ncbi:restriction endonuclease subunit S, partial [Avibacterium paragallinarum]
SGARTDGLLNISFEGFMDIAITIPTLPEQQKIGALFRRLDRLITLHKRKWDDVILLKKALLQKMFPKNGERLPEIRFPEFSGDWETHPFKKIAGIRKEHFAQETVSIDIELENLMSDLGEIVGDTSLRTQATSAFKKGDVLFGRLRPYLNKWWLADCDGVKSGEIWALFPLRKVSSLFLYLLVQSKPFLEAANVSSGSKMPRAEWKIIEEVEVMLPSLPEQQKIGTFFRRLDRLISHHQQQYEHYQLLKKALLQQMFI